MTRRITLLGILVWASVVSAADMAGVDELLKLTGTVQKINSMPEGAASLVDQRMGDMPAREKDAVRVALVKAFEAGPILESVRQSVSKGLSDEHLQSSLKWFNSPLGQKILKLEDATKNPKAQSQMEAFVKEFEKKQPDAKKAEMAQSIVHESGSVEAMVSITYSVTKAMMVAMNAARPKKEQVSERQIVAQMSQMKTQLAEPLSNAALVATLFMFKDTSAKDQEAYLAYLKTGAGREYNQAVIKGMETALEKASQAIGRTIASQLKAKAKKP